MNQNLELFLELPKKCSGNTNLVIATYVKACLWTFHLKHYRKDEKMFVMYLFLQIPVSQLLIFIPSLTANPYLRYDSFIVSSLVCFSKKIRLCNFTVYICPSVFQTPLTFE